VVRVERRLVGLSAAFVGAHAGGKVGAANSTSAHQLGDALRGNKRTCSVVLRSLQRRQARIFLPVSIGTSAGGLVFFCAVVAMAAYLPYTHARTLRALAKRQRTLVSRAPPH
jgi:hypothetical protein